MKTKTIKILGLIAAFVSWTAIAFAGTETFEFFVSAHLPEASGFKCDVMYQPAGGGDWTLNPGGTTLDFGSLQDAGTPQGTTYGWFSSSFAQFFVCDLAPVNGVGIPTVTFQYTPGNNPNANAGAPYNQRGGLEKKGILTVARVTGSGTNTTETVHKKGIFDDINAGGFNIDDSVVYGGWVRTYFGLGFIPQSGTIDPANAEAFTGLDHHGTYEGTVIATATW